MVVEVQTRLSYMVVVQAARGRSCLKGAAVPVYECHCPFLKLRCIGVGAGAQSPRESAAMVFLCPFLLIFWLCACLCAQQVIRLTEMKCVKEEQNNECKESYGSSAGYQCEDRSSGLQGVDCGYYPRKSDARSEAGSASDLS